MSSRGAGAPLGGRRIVVTRAADQASVLASLLAERGAEPIEIPVTRIEALDPAPLRAAIGRLAEYDWTVFTSQNGVRVFWDVLVGCGEDSRALANTKVVAVGPATAEALRERGVELNLQPERFVAEGILDAMIARDDVRGARVLYAAAEGAREVIPHGLEAAGARVDRVDIYRSAPVVDGGAAMRARIERGDVDLVTYTAGSAVRAFVGAVGLEAARRVPAASIGPVTSTVAREIGLTVAVEARESTIPGLVEAIERHFTVLPRERTQ